MHSLNPFLRAFFRSNIPSQCNPVHLHILLVPTTEVLLTSKDRETNSTFIDLAGSEDFLASHVLRIPETSGALGGKELGTSRDSRGKAKQFTTVNGRTVVVKESFVYSNKGFRTLNQAQLLTDIIYYHDGLEAQQWLVYYISKPLVGTVEPIKITPALLPQIYASAKSTPKPPRSSTPMNEGGAFSTINPDKKDIKSFGDLLNSFPMIARQMQPGLEKVFKDFQRDISKPLPSPTSRPNYSSSRRTSVASTHSTRNGSIHSRFSNGHIKSPSTLPIFTDDEEDHMRRTLESAVNSAIDLFRQVDKQQLSLLGATTDLTGSLVERLIERHITEQVSDQVLFLRICSIHKLEDLELESSIHHMTHIDVAQVGIDIDGGRSGKQELTSRLSRGVDEFKKLSFSRGPQEMLEILLATQKTITMTSTSDAQNRTGSIDDQGSIISEKPKTNITMSADTLVSLLLVVVIRAGVRYLQARLSFMRNFIFIDDVEGGELGYALSTFEAVLSYLATDSGGLKIASRRNRRLWQATKRGNLLDMKAILKPDESSLSDEQSPDSDVQGEEATLDGMSGTNHLNQEWESTSHDNDTTNNRLSQASTEADEASKDSNLSHVFPFQALKSEEPPTERPRAIKRVSMDLRSLSNASEFSFHSRTTIDSAASCIEGDTSIEKLCQTEDSSGDSVLMMAVEARQPEALSYLLTLEEYYPYSTVLEDCSREDTTLLSAAIQLAHTDLIAVMVDYVLQVRDIRHITSYISKPDKRGRTMAHYLFNAPELMDRFGTLIPWRQKDKNGQTPLLALCRSYDHPKYLDMVNMALQCATDEQDDDDSLHLDNHVDAKGNTLLHVVSDPYLALRILQHCDADPNAPNNKQFTPLMVASKFGRFDLIRFMFLDKRVDIYAKEHRGMTAVELAKDDDVRNRIDDMILVTNPPATDGRVTAVVRSFFVEDGTIRLIIKSAARSADGMIAVTTCKRSLTDFENLAKWLSIEHPASWLPSIFNFRTPFQIPSKPSRAVLHDIQVRLNNFLRIMLAHSTFSTHELLWEFILAPEIQPEMMAERSMKKAEIRSEKVKEEYEPVDDIRDVESFVGHARESIRGVNHSTKSLIRRVNSVRNATIDFSVAIDLSSKALSTLAFLSPPHITAFAAFARTLLVPESDPHKLFHQDLQAISSTVLAILSSLSRPHTLIASLVATQKSMDRHHSSLRRSDRWPLGLLDETRKSMHSDAEERLEKAKEDLRGVGCELRYTQQSVAAELAGWQDLHGRMARRAVRKLAGGMVVRERDRLEGMRRAIRGVVGNKEKK